MTATDTFPCYMVRKEANGKIEAKVERISKGDLPPGDVLIRVEYSSLNYKDALASQGHPGVVRSLPHVPGIDCAGTVVESSSANFRAGDEVLVTGYDLVLGIGVVTRNLCACRRIGLWRCRKASPCATR